MAQPLFSHLCFPQSQNPVPEAAEQRAGQAEEPELLHGVRSWDGWIEAQIEEEE